MIKNKKMLIIIVLVLIIFMSSQKKEATVCTSGEPSTIESYDLGILETLGTFEPYGCNIYDENIIVCGGSSNDYLIISDVAGLGTSCYYEIKQFYDSYQILNTLTYKSVQIYDVKDAKYICETSGGDYDNECKCPITKYYNFEGGCNDISSLAISECEALSGVGVNCYNAAPGYAEWDYFYEGICECQFSASTSYVQYWNILNCDTTCNSDTGCLSFCSEVPDYTLQETDKFICKNERGISSGIGGTNSNILNDYIDEFYTCEETQPPTSDKEWYENPIVWIIAGLFMMMMMFMMRS